MNIGANAFIAFGWRRAGATDEHRALNYLAAPYQAIYATAADAHARNCSLSGVETRVSRLSGTRKVTDVIFSFTNRSTDVDEKHFVRVDVTDEFPFLVTKLSPYYDRGTLTPIGDSPDFEPVMIPRIGGQV